MATTSDSVEALRKIVALNPHGENRPQQETAVEEIEAAFDGKHSLLIQLPTGGGKSLSYLVPLVMTGTRAVISTATKQLSDQLIKVEIPTLKRAFKQVSPGTKINSALLKGRDNYYCWLKDQEASKLSSAAEALFGEDTTSTREKTSSGKKIAGEIRQLTDWANESNTGDRTEAPVVSDQVWRQYSSTSTECVGRNACPFGDICFAEKARDRARKADIVVTNHAVVGHDLMAEGEGILGEREAYVFDELHELDNYLSNAWGTRLTGKMITDTHKALRQYSDLGEKDIEQVEKVGKKYDKMLEMLPNGLITSMPEELTALLNNLLLATTRISTAAGKKANGDISESLKSVVNVLKKRSDEILSATSLLLDASVETVRWKTTSDKEAISLNAAPLRIGPRLQQALASRDAIMIGTSATITVGGGFEIPVHNLGLDMTENYRTIELDSPFNFQQQGIMYIPDQYTFPAPVGANRTEHSAAILKETEDLVAASGGRALILSTTMFGANALGKHLRKKFPKLNVMIQGDAPNAQLVDEFKKDETSVLAATMGFWHGVDVRGPALSLVVIDKLPFKPMDDPLSVARQNYAQLQGRNGFMDVYVSEANVMLAQAVGRLVRAKTDRGVVAIFDTRLLTKPYGPSILKSLPNMKVFSDKKKIIGALERLVASYK
jgi:ATP-dependent DNA helicase DinG